ncbi:MAG TPA: hypothetical protein ENI89_08790 [Desulfobulbus sp.]|nr:hypothetical protein [Desulfobulbus sp.]
MKRYASFSILILAAVITIAWQGLLPQSGYGRDAGGTHPVLMKGWIDQVGTGTLVIDDMPYRDTSETRYFDGNGKESGPSILRVGQFVGFLAENSVLTEVHVLKPSEEDMRPEVKAPSRSNPGENSQIILEDGVWRN